ncbi:acyltransferase [Ruminococcaceae bacterium OttesenSCG-928-I18]|nr:acyltransferase [Ruminococcaceae bacterium OttesenSCG-928-I18]
MAKQEHRYEISIVRLLATLSIFFCHLLEQSGMTVLGNYLSVGVQIFLCMSGYLYSGRRFETGESVLKFYSGGLRKVLLPYYLYILLFALPVYYILMRAAVTPASVFGALTTSSAIWGIHHFWYIPYCLFCYLITPLLSVYFDHIDKRHGAWGFLGHSVLLLAAVSILSYAFNSYFISAWVNCYIVGFALPYLLTKKNRAFRMWKITAALAPLTTFANIMRWYLKYQLQYTSDSTLRQLLVSHFYYFSQALLGIFCFLLVYTLSHVFIRRYGVYFRRLLMYTDRYSYTFYITHMIYIKGVLTVVGYTGSYVLDGIIAFALSVASGVALYYLVLLVGRVFARRKKPA